MLLDAQGKPVLNGTEPFPRLEDFAARAEDTPRGRVYAITFAVRTSQIGGKALNLVCRQGISAAELATLFRKLASDLDALAPDEPANDPDPAGSPTGDAAPH